MNSRSTALAVIALTTTLSTAPIAHSYDGPGVNGVGVVVTETGPVRGTVNPRTIAFLGIPFAEPPVGNLRWRPPEPRGRWTDVLDVAQPGKHCPQSSAVADPNASEACLFLNIYVPREPKVERPFESLPVMVWIHGGANANGASETYDPTPMVETGRLIAVTLNYRLGVFGFLAHPAIDAEGHATSNYGVMDQQLAMKWVRTNIGRFGGDPQNVTIFGESAGGLNAITHLVSPRSAGLFDRAIIQSGAYQLKASSLSASEGLGVAFASAVGCANQTAACLRAIPAADVIAHGANAFNQSTVDGQILPETQLAALAAGRFNRVPVIQGANSHEGRFFVPTALSELGYQLTLFGIAAAAGKSADEVFARYPLSAYPSPFEAASAPFGDAAFACTAAASSQLLAHWVPTYAYEFDDAGASPLGAMHTAELRYLFNLNLGGPPVGPASLPAPSQLLASHMRSYWSNFAQSSNPNSLGEPEWKTVSEGQLQSFAAPSPNAETLATFGTRHQCSFWVG